MTRPETGAIQLQAKEYRGLRRPAEARRGKKGFYLKAQREHEPAVTLIADF